MKLRAKLLLGFFTVMMIPVVVILFQGNYRENDRLVELLTGSVSILVAAACLIIVWVYASILRPLGKLQEATNQIKEGNLDFSLEVEGGDEIGRLFQDFEEMRIRLRENEMEKLRSDLDSKELISNISHDLKTPITAIKGYVEGIMDGVASSPEKLDKYIKTIYNKVNDMDRLIDELTFYTKIDTNRIPYNYDRIQILGFFGDCAEEVGLEMESGGVEFSFQANLEETTEVIADGEQLKRVVNNIIANSLKYMDKKPGRIVIRLLDEGDFVRVEISDNGRGIAAQDLPYVFERFYRADSSRNSLRGGSGIGLSIVKKIIEDHGGRIWAKSREGYGTDIIILLRKYQESFVYE